MNRFEKWFCSTALWRWVTQRNLLPWLLSGSDLGDQVLEVGAGAGAGTRALRKLAAHVTSLEYDHDFAVALSRLPSGGNGGIVQGDAAALPFRDRAFSAVLAVLVLHHLQSPKAQDLAFAEIYRVLRPEGVFLAFEIQDNWLHRISHTRSTFVPVAPSSVSIRLGRIGFSRVTVDFRGGAFRLRAFRAS